MPDASFFMDAYKEKNPKEKVDFRGAHIRGFTAGRPAKTNEQVVRDCLGGKNAGKAKPKANR